jgi:hypothetical protein
LAAFATYAGEGWYGKLYPLRSSLIVW